jgi:parvulin-like peptidyl-prolyl isomerase
MHIRLRLVPVLIIALLAGCGIPTPIPESGVEPLAATMSPTMLPTTSQPQTGISAMSTAVPAPGTAASTEPERKEGATSQPTIAAQKSPIKEANTVAPQTGEDLPPGSVASVNGAVITQTAYELRVAQAQIYLFQQPGLDTTTPAGQAEIERLRERVLEWMIDEILIEQAAEEGVGTNAPIQVTAEQVEQQVNALRGDDASRFNRWLASNGLTLDQLREQIRSDLITSAVRDQVTADVDRAVPQVRVRHILVSEESVAAKALGELRSGRDFAVVARQYSEDMATRNSGGDLGFVPRGVMPRPVEEIAFGSQAGQISDIIYTESGLHIIQVVEIDPSREVTPDLWPVIQQNAFESWLQTQRDKADLHIASTARP